MYDAMGRGYFSIQDWRFGGLESVVIYTAKYAFGFVRSVAVRWGSGVKS